VLRAWQRERDADGCPLGGALDDVDGAGDGLAPDGGMRVPEGARTPR
jgi:hypothetical protein